MTLESVVICPSPPWRAFNFKELCEFRDLVLILGARDIKLRYRQTALGVGWVVLQPLLGAAMFALVGMVAWGEFSGALIRGNGSLIQNPRLISKIFFPRLVLPLW